MKTKTCPLCNVDKTMHDRIADHILQDHIDLMTAHLRADHFANAAMHLLAEVSVHIDEWNFPVTLDERVTALLNEFYGKNIRPQIKTGDADDYHNP